MAGKGSRAGLFGLNLLFLLGVLTANSGHAGHGSAGLRLWYSNWSVHRRAGVDLPEDLGEAPMYVGQVSYSLEQVPVSLSAQYGQGDGWDGDHERTDLLVAAAYGVSQFHCGVGYHRLRQASPGYECDQRGIELLGGVALPVGQGFTISLMLGFVPALSWEAEEAGILDDHGAVSMYTYDANVGYDFERLRLAVGYRAQHIEGGDGDRGYSWISPDDYSGFYGSAVVLF